MPNIRLWRDVQPAIHLSSTKKGFLITVINRDAFPLDLMIYLQHFENHIFGITIPMYTLYDVKQIKFGYNSNHAVF